MKRYLPAFVPALRNPNCKHCECQGCAARLGRRRQRGSRAFLAVRIWYSREAGAENRGSATVHAFRQTVECLVQKPGVGMLRRFRHPGLKDIRSFADTRSFPCPPRVLPSRRREAGRVPRVLHGMRDLPRRLVEPPRLGRLITSKPPRPVRSSAPGASPRSPRESGAWRRGRICNRRAGSGLRGCRFCRARWRSLCPPISSCPTR